MSSRKWHLHCRVLILASCITLFGIYTFASTELLFVGQSMPRASCVGELSLVGIHYEDISHSRKVLPTTHGENMWNYRDILKTPQNYLARRGIPTTYGAEPWGGTNVQEVLGIEDFSLVEINLMRQILKTTQDKEVQKKVAEKNQWPKTEKRPAYIPDDYFEVGGFIITLRNGERHFLLHTSYERTMISHGEAILADFMKSEGIHLHQVFLLQSFHNHPGDIPILSEGDMEHKRSFLGTLRHLLGDTGTAFPTLHFYSFLEINGVLVVGHASHVASSP